MIGPVLPSAGALRPLGVEAVRLRGGFWGERQERNAVATIPHVRRWLEETGWLGDFRLAATDDLVSFRRRGREFSDSEVYKLAEAMVWEIARGGGARVDELSTVVTVDGGGELTRRPLSGLARRRWHWRRTRRYATVRAADSNGWPYGTVGAAPAEPGRLTLVPYHLWANRGPASMRVWLPVTSQAE